MSVGEEAPAAETEELQDQEAQIGTEPELEQPITDTGEQEAADEATGDEPSAEAEEEEEGAWRQDPEVLDFAASAGIPPGELEDYGDKYELERAVRNYDRRRHAGLSEQAQPPPPQQPPPVQPPSQPPALPAIDREVIEGPVADAIDALGQYYEGKMTAFSSQLDEVLGGFQQQALMGEVHQFHEVVDSLGNEDLFGKAETLVPGSKQDLNRQRAITAYAFLENRQPTKAMIQRAINQEFWSELKKEDRQQLRSRLRKQRGRVLPGRGHTGASTATREELAEGGISSGDKADLVREHRKMTG